MDFNKSSVLLRKLLRRVKVIDLVALFRVLKTNSRMTVFRHLKNIGYLSSFSHRGGYYTLREIPEFNEQGLWFHRGIGFSRYGKLNHTVIELVEKADSGMVYKDFNELLRLNVHNTLLSLVKGGNIRREIVDNRYVYISSKARKGNKQIKNRVRLMEEARAIAKLPTDAEAILILVELIKHPDVDTKKLAATLKSKGMQIDKEVIDKFLIHHDLIKKTVDMYL